MRTPRWYSFALRVVSLQVVLDARAFPPTESQLADLLAETPVLVVLGGEDGTKSNTQIQRTLLSALHLSCWIVRLEETLSALLTIACSANVLCCRSYMELS